MFLESLVTHTQHLPFCPSGQKKHSSANPNYHVRDQVALIAFQLLLHARLKVCFLIIIYALLNTFTSLPHLCCK